MAQIFSLPEWLCFTSLDVSTLLVLTATFAVAVTYFRQRRPENLPPLLPGGWPWLGHLPAILTFNREPQFQLIEWAKEQGSIYTVQFWRDEVTVVSGYTAIKEMLEKEVFSSRYDECAMTAIGSDQDIFMAPFGEPFRQRRRFATSVFRRLGVKMGPGSIQNQIQEEARSVCDKISGYAEQPFDISADLTTAAGNIICALVFGQRFGYNDARFRRLQTTMKNLGAGMVAFHLPIVHFITGDPMEGVRFYASVLKEFIREEIDRHRLNFDPEDPRDFIDYCLLQLEKQEGGGTWFNDDNVVLIVMDLFIAGMDTTANTLAWVMLYMILHPDIQEKVQAELDSVLGANKPSMTHRDQLPFTTATIMEAQRIRHIGPLLFGRTATESTRLCGFDIPKGTYVLPNLASVHMDPEVWPNPDVFDPNRFLDKDGKVVTNPPSFLPFSTGRRNCLGEQLAKMELFILFSTILQHFALKVPGGVPSPSTEGKLTSLGVGPLPFELCAIPR